MQPVYYVCVLGEQKSNHFVWKLAKIVEIIPKMGEKQAFKKKNRKLTKLGHGCLYFVRKRPNIVFLPAIIKEIDTGPFTE